MSFSPGDIVINQAMISGGGGSVDIALRMHDFNVYESITKPYSSIVATIIDNADIINNNVDLNGQNTLSISFNQPGMAPYTGNFLLMAIEKSVKLENQRTAIYKMSGYSPHMKNPVLVNKSYKNQSHTSIASDLAKNFLGVTKPLKLGAAAMGLAGNEKFPYMVNNQGVFKAIRQALSRASSTMDQSSAYMFFENNKSTIIDTLENLLKQAQGSPVATYYQRPMGTDFLLDGVRQQFTILDLEEESRVNTAEQQQNTSQQVNTHDFFSHQFKSILQSFGGGGGGAKRKHNIPHNNQAPPTFLKNVLPQRSKVAGVFDSQAVTIQVMLNTALTVGCGFNVQTLAPPGDTDIVALDKLSGPLLASEVRHSCRFDNVKPQGTTVVRGVKGTLSPDTL